MSHRHPLDRMNKPIALALALATLSSGQSWAETASPMTDTDTNTDLSKEIENPASRRITLPLRYEADFLDGAYYPTTFDIDQAVVPFQLWSRPSRGCNFTAVGDRL